MKKIFIFLLVVSLFGSLFSMASNGKEIFERQGCNKCHSINSLKIERINSGEDEGPDLSDIGNKYNPEWLTKWIKKRVKKKNKDGEMAKHTNRWKGGDSQLEPLVQFLSGLKAK